MKQINANVNTETLCVFNDPSLGAKFSSFSPDSVEGKIKLYNAINSPDNRLADFINTPILIRDVVVSKVEMSERMDQTATANPFTPDGDNVKREGFRVIIIDTDGQSYTATSTGVYNSVSTLRSIFGTLHFEDGMKAIVKQVKTKNGNTLTLALSE